MKKRRHVGLIIAAAAVCATTIAALFIKGRENTV